MDETSGMIDRALRAATDTRFLVMEAGARRRSAAVFASAFGAERAVIVADPNTFAAAGRDVQDSFRNACEEPFLFGSDVYAEYAMVDRLRAALEGLRAIPVAVGSGTINDITKLAAHRLGRPYMVVATAASMDGYTSYGASITRGGCKLNIDCAAPRAVVVDLDVIAGAPDGMNPSGYADLLAKCAAGADWIIASAAGVEPVDPLAWEMVQAPLRGWVGNPRGIAQSDPDCLRNLMYGLLVSGFAMQAHRSSRPAAGAEHQFSHLWDMQHHTHDGQAPSHGFKVGIGTLASLALHEELLRHEHLPSGRAGWPPIEKLEARIRELLGPGEVSEISIAETRAKYVGPEALRAELGRLAAAWPELRRRLKTYLPSFAEVRDMLREAGCPHEPEHIGIPRERLRRSYELAWLIRSRYTVLDMAQHTGLIDGALEKLFGPGGRWEVSG